MDHTGAADKRVLLIGINDYPMLPGRSLAGCVNDMLAMRAVLIERFGFPEGATEVLRNEQATRETILTALDRLVERTCIDDVVVGTSPTGSTKRSCHSTVYAPRTELRTWCELWHLWMGSQSRRATGLRHAPDLATR